MASRLELHALLKAILPDVYYQPPESLKLKYPCIVYSLNRIDPQYADNDVYSKARSYQIILIHKNPDNTEVDAIADLPRCRMDRAPYVSNNLYHYPFTIYF